MESGMPIRHCSQVHSFLKWLCLSGAQLCKASFSCSFLFVSNKLVKAFLLLFFKETNDGNQIRKTFRNFYQMYELNEY